MSYIVDQFCSGFSSGDAISTQALIIRNDLRSSGVSSNIYCDYFSEKSASEVEHYRYYKDSKKGTLLYHHSYYSDFLKVFSSLKSRKILIFHNITPAEFIAPYNKRVAEMLTKAREILTISRDQFQLAVADSHYNARELEEMGYKNVIVMPVPVSPHHQTSNQTFELPRHLSWLNSGHKHILFVGRIVPNKCHHDLIKAFYFYHKIEPESRLILVGGFHPNLKGYVCELRNLITELQLNHHVILTGMVPDDDLIHYYRHSDLFLSMSEHEGFLVPLLESMIYDLPVMAYRSTVIPETLGGAGVLFNEKKFPQVAECINEILTRPDIQENIIRSQRERLLDFDTKKSLSILKTILM